MENCIYRFLNKNEEVIYIGKAKNLIHRFNTHYHLPKECYQEVVKVEYCEFETEYEMDFAERYYIPKLKPKYNVVLKEKPMLLDIAEFDNVIWVKYEKNKNICNQPKQPKSITDKAKVPSKILISKELDRSLKINKKTICTSTGEIFNSLSEIEFKYNIPIDDLIMNCEGKIILMKESPTYKCNFSFMYYDDYINLPKWQIDNINRHIKINTSKIICLTTSEVFINLNEVEDKYKTNRVVYCCDNLCNYAGVVDGKPMVWKWYDDYLDMKISEIEYYIWKAVYEKFKRGEYVV